MHSLTEDSLTLEPTSEDNVLLPTLEDGETLDVALTDQLTCLTSTLSLSSTGTTRRDLSLDSRVPFEIWDRIGHFLHPPELFLLSRVSQTLRKHVRSFMVWKNWCHEYFQRAGILQVPLTPHPDSWHHMQCMSAIRPLICEGCGSCERLNDLPEDRPWRLPLQWKANGYSNVTILLCDTCRKLRYNKYPRRTRDKEAYPEKIVGSYLTKADMMQKYRRYNVGRDTVKAITNRQGRARSFWVTYSECALWETLRERLGGEVALTTNAKKMRRMARDIRLRLSHLSSQSLVETTPIQ